MQNQKNIFYHCAFDSDPVDSENKCIIQIRPACCALLYFVYVMHVQFWPVSSAYSFLINDVYRVFCKANSPPVISPKYMHVLYLFSKSKTLSAEDEYPDIGTHCNHMAKVLTLDMYKRLRKRPTPSGFTIDQVIQTGVDHSGKRTHILSGIRVRG